MHNYEVLSTRGFKTFNYFFSLFVFCFSFDVQYPYESLVNLDSRRVGSHSRYPELQLKTSA